MNFSKNLKDLRTKSGLTQEQLAKLLNTEKYTIQKWEQNKNIKTFEILEKLKEILNCSYDDLLK